MWLSTSAARRLWAEVTAWRSPVKWRLMRAEGSSFDWPPPVPPPFWPNTGPREGSRSAHAEPPRGLGEADRAGGLALARWRGADRRDEDEPRLQGVGAERDLRPYLCGSAAPGLDVVRAQPQIGGDVEDVAQAQCAFP